MIPVFLLLLMIFSPLSHADEWTPVDPKHDDPVRVTPSVCLMVHFGDNKTDPLYPGSNNSLAEGPDKLIYGASSNGACANCHGMVFKMTPDGQFSIIHVFDGIDGDGPSGGVAKASDGNFYGTTYGGGKVEVVESTVENYVKYTKTGTIFKFAAGSNSVTPVWSFRNGWLRRILKGDPPHSDKEKKDAPPSYPVSPPVTNLAGMTMGVTSYANNQRYGALYSLAGGEYSTVETMDGTKAIKPVSLSPGVTDNNFYGVTTYGRPGNLFGTVFKTSGGPIEILHEFNGDDGASPSNVIQGKDKRLYGTTYTGGMYKRRTGLIYRMNADGTDFKILHHFNGAEGSNSVSALVWGKDNRLYGTARWGGTGKSGVLFRINPDGSNYVVLHSFKMYITGRAPLGNMIQHSDGNFYGTTSGGGRHNAGGIFRMDVGLSKRNDIYPAGSRYCCSLGQNQLIALWTAPSLDPLLLGGHEYGAQQSGDPIGFVYTTRAGLLDIGHVRDMIDLTKYFYDWLMNSDRNNLQMLKVPEGFIRPIRLPMDQDEVLKIAGAMAYIHSWAHELSTWGQGITKDPGPAWKLWLPNFTVPQDFSSFSPEDLVSNVVGIEIAQRVIRLRCERDFNKAVDVEMLKMMKELNAQPIARTDEVRDTIEGFRFGPKAGKWFAEYGTWETLWRRNFYVNPWLVPYENLGAYRPGWLNERRFQPYYNYFDFGITGAVDGTPGITIELMRNKTEALRKDWENENPGMTRWP